MRLREISASDFLIHDSGSPDDVVPEAQQHSMENLPVDTLVYLLGSRYCETDRFTQFAGHDLEISPRGGNWFSRYAIMCISIFSLVISTPIRRKPHGKPMSLGRVFAGTLRIW